MKDKELNKKIISEITNIHKELVRIASGIESLENNKEALTEINKLIHNLGERLGIKMANNTKK